MLKLRHLRDLLPHLVWVNVGKDERSGTNMTFDGAVAEMRDFRGRDWRGMGYLGWNMKEFVVVPSLIGIVWD